MKMFARYFVVSLFLLLVSSASAAMNHEDPMGPGEIEDLARNWSFDNMPLSVSGRLLDNLGANLSQLEGSSLCRADIAALKALRLRLDAVVSGHEEKGEREADAPSGCLNMLIPSCASGRQGRQRIGLVEPYQDGQPGLPVAAEEKLPEDDESPHVVNYPALPVHNRKVSQPKLASPRAKKAGRKLSRQESRQD